MQGWERAINTYQSEDPSPTIPTHRMKEEKGKTVGDKNGASKQIGRRVHNVRSRNSVILRRVHLY